jgi:ribonuclease T2
MRHRLLSLFLAGLLFLLPAGAGSGRADASDFDFYVLSLSWSPSWCAANDKGRRSAQCKRSLGFIVHGLWPQNERGWPENCSTDEPDWLPNELIRSYFDLIPSAGLAAHEWRKHGTCSGLSQQRYFQTLRAAYSKVKLPPVIFDGRIDRNLAITDIERLMSQSNPGLSANGIAVACERGKLEEIRICLTKSLTFRACPEVDRNACRQRILSVPAIP